MSHMGYLPTSNCILGKMPCSLDSNCTRVIFDSSYWRNNTEGADGSLQEITGVYLPTGMV